MAGGFSRQRRQRIIDEFLSETGSNIFIPGRFVDWLKDRPEHELHRAFFGMPDDEAARQFRIGMARRMASGLRIVTKVQVTDPESRVVSIAVREFPAFVSPMAGRAGGGGYGGFDPTDPAMLRELRRQGAGALRSWLNRYRGAFEAEGVDLSVVEALAESEDASVEVRAAGA